MIQLSRVSVPALLIAVALVFMTGCSSDSSRNESRSTVQIPQVTAANETAVIARLISIAKAEALYAATEGNGSYGTLDQLIEQHDLVDPSQGKFGQSYRIEVTLKPVGGFEVTAVPVNYPITGRRSFFVDDSNVVRAADKEGRPATAQDPPI